MQISKNKLIILLLAVSCQLMDVSIGPLKFWEFASFFVFIFYARILPPAFRIATGVFTFHLILSLVATYTNDATFFYFSFLKSKYVISVVRYIEMILCLIVMILPLNLTRNGNLSFDFFVRNFVFYNRIIICAILSIYLFERLTGFQFVSYGDDYRLKGFYVEGGPYGLYLASLFLCELFFAKIRLFGFVYVVALFFSASKAGYALFVLGMFMLLFFRVKQLKNFVNIKNKIRFLLFAVSISLIIMSTVYYLASNYVVDMINIEKEIASRSDDTSLVMGRISGFYIGLNIILNNPLIGVGSGNYSLVRNHDLYRDFFPVIYEWDLTGLGGLLTLLIESGVIGLIIFLFFMIKIMPINSHKALQFSLLFWFPFVLGAQLYMVYPWVYLGMYLLYKDVSENNQL